jgi:hypothetical protein
MFIDEINRGNAAQIFGELITFLDFDYRDTLPDGGPNHMALPVPLVGPVIDPSTNETEEIDRLAGTTIRLPANWHFPRHLYIVATMNSVDRAAIPLDSALARRFDRIELRPHLSVLASALGIQDLDDRAQRVRDPATSDWSGATPQETAVLLLERLNFLIANDLGEDFELGQGLLWQLVGVSETSAWTTLFQLWDEVLFPQLQERFLGRPGELMNALKVFDPPPEHTYAFRLRRLLGSQAEAEGSVDVPRLSGQPLEVAQNTLRWLAR